MHFAARANRRYAQFERLQHEPGLIHAFSTRPADVSPRPGGSQAARAGRRRQMAADLGLAPERLCYCVQVHQTHVARIAPAQPGGPLEGYDGVVSAVPGVPVMTFSADCPLILLFDPQRRVVGLAHASWRCTTAALTRRVVEVMQRCGAEARDLHAGIGPGAGPCCYEVREDVVAAAAGLPGRAGLFQERSGRLYFDLWQANRALLLDAGVRAENIETAGICTMCQGDEFYSFRREGPGCGHFGLLAALTAQ